MNLKQFNARRAKFVLHEVNHFTRKARKQIERAMRKEAESLVALAADRESGHFMNIMKFRSNVKDHFFAVVLHEDEKGQAIIAAEAPQDMTEAEVVRGLNDFMQASGSEYVRMIDPEAN